MLTGFSLEPPASEAEFLRRELGIHWRQVTEDELRSSVTDNPRTLIIMSEPEPYIRTVRQAPAASLTSIMISDEAYSLERLRLATQPAIHQVYRHYPIQPASWRVIAACATGYIRDSRGTSQRATTVAPNIRSGMRVRARMRHWEEISSKVTSIPLGYTDSFALAFSDRFEITENESLFACEVTQGETRQRSVVFRGNRGLAQRIVGCERTRLIRDSEVELIDAEWSARAAEDVAGAYVDSLLSARFALCPPGFANNESFRFYEALVCGALPIEASVASTHLGSLRWRNAGSISQPSWIRGLRQAETMSETERLSRVRSARRLVAGDLQDLADRIRADMESA